MPYFYFDLVTNKAFHQQGSMILEVSTPPWIGQTNLLPHFMWFRPELRGCGCAIRVTDEDGEEFYRTPLDALPAFGRK